MVLVETFALFCAAPVTRFCQCHRELETLEEFRRFESLFQSAPVRGVLMEKPDEQPQPQPGLRRDIAAWLGCDALASRGNQHARKGCNGLGYAGVLSHDWLLRVVSPSHSLTNAAARENAYCVPALG